MRVAMGDAYLDLGHPQLLDHLLDPAANGYHRLPAGLVADLNIAPSDSAPPSRCRGP